MNKGKASAGIDEVALDKTDDVELARLVREREHEATIHVSLDELPEPAK